MSSDPTETTDRTDTAETRSRLEALEGHLPRDNTLLDRHVSVIRGHVTEYEESDSGKDQRDLVDRMEAELEHLRDAIESEVEEDTEKAHELVDRLEEKVANLR